SSVFVLTQRSTVFPVLSHFLPFYLAAFCLLSVNHFPFSENYDQMLVYGLALPHYFWQEIVWTVLLLAAGIGLARRSPLAAGMLLDAGALLLVMVTLVDFQLSRQMGFRLDWNAVTASNDPVMLWRTIRPFVGQ